MAYKFIAVHQANEETTEAALIPLSEDGKHLLYLINQPQISRTPAGYKREFLEAYIPNTTSYLTAAEKQQLAESGKTARQGEPAGTYAKDILQRLIDLSYNSSRLEGNTYSLLDTQCLLSVGQAAENKSAKDSQMIVNHKEAIEFLVANSQDIGFNRYTILNIHALLSSNLLSDPAASGRLKKFSVGIEQSVFTPPWNTAGN